MASHPRAGVTAITTTKRGLESAGPGSITEPPPTPAPQSIAEKLHVTQPAPMEMPECRVSVQKAIRALEVLELFELQMPDGEFDKERLFFLTKRRRELEEVLLWEKRKKTKGSRHTV